MPWALVICTPHCKPTLRGSLGLLPTQTSTQKLTFGGLSEGVPSGLCRSHTLIFESIELTAATECKAQNSMRIAAAVEAIPKYDPAATASSDHSPCGTIAQA